jgi:PemK-like, MazF-like toxin of type II toxin-antitoxin system
VTSAWKDAAARIGRFAVREAPRILRQLQQSRRRPATPPAAPPTGRAPARPRSAPPTGRHLVYAPQRDGQADPGEIVWTWVVYEDDPHQGKDRPVLVVGRLGSTLLGLMLSSQSERDSQRNWFPLGPGSWDRDGRPSWVRLDRVLEVDEDGIRREGAVLDRSRFDAVADRLRGQYGWE